MSTLYDRVARGHFRSLYATGHREHIIEALSKATVIKADEVYDYFFRRSTEEGPGQWSLASAIPACTPLCESCFIEGSLANGAPVSPSWREAGLDPHSLVSWGLLLHATDRLAGEVPEEVEESFERLLAKISKNMAPLISAHDEHHQQGSENGRQEREAEAAEGSKHSGALPAFIAEPRRVIYALLYIQLRGEKPLEGAAQFVMCVEPDGSLARLKSTEEPAIFTSKARACDKRLSKLQHRVLPFALPPLLALSLSGCEGVKLVEHVPPAKLSRRHKKKYGLPLAPYSTLDMGPMREVLDEEGQARTRGLEHALRQCRDRFTQGSPAADAAEDERQLPRPLMSGPVPQPAALAGAASTPAQKRMTTIEGRSHNR